MLPLAQVMLTLPGVLAPADSGGLIVVAVGKVVSCDDENHVYSPGMVICEAGRIAYVGPPIETRGIEQRSFEDSWAVPGFVDLHTHIHGRGINDMVQAVNPELRAGPTVDIPANRRVRVGMAAGTTTLFGIPGSGTNMGGFGVLYKSKPHVGYEEMVVRDPGGLKVAQDSNPQRRNASDFGVSRAGQGWNLADVNDRAVSALERDVFDPALEWLKQVHSGELPVLIHTASAEGVVNTARMWRETYETRSILSHGSFDGWKSAPAVAEYGIPVNHGPRTIDFYSSRNGRINGSAAIYDRAGDNFSLNTDSGVVAEEEFSLQGAMGARYDGDTYRMLRALTIHPARAFGIDDRVGSLEEDKDPDVVVWTGDPLDPRSCVELVIIDGEVTYDREVDGQWW